MSETLPSQLPRLLEQGEYIRERELLPLLPFARSTLVRMVLQERFPAPHRLSPGIKVWRIRDILDWFSQLP